MQEVQIVATADVWQRMRGEPQFVEIMRLARAANSLSLAYAPIFVPIEDQSPRARRNRFAALVYSTALLKEGLHTVRSLGKWYRDRQQYREGVATILSDPVVQTFESELASKVRDELVFHFDRQAMAIGLERLPDGETIVSSYPVTGPEIGETYFDIADDAVFAYLFGDAQSADAYIARIEKFMEENTELFTRFLAAAHRLVAIALVEYGCLKRTAERTVDSDGNAT